VIGPGEEGYDEARSIWNAMIDRRPAAIVRCSGTADVIAAVRFAREHDRLVAVRGGGHNVAGDAVSDGGFVIDLSRLRGASIDPEARIARVQPGTTWADLDHETQAFGLAVPGGLVSMTGVAGFTLGGGVGWLTRRYGFAADSLTAADLVTADGEYLRVDEHQHPDLLWGLRGGGGNFGVATSLEFRLHEAGPTVFAGPRAWPMERAPEVLRCFRELTANAPDELTMLAILRIAPPAPWIPPQHHGRPVIVLVSFYSGEAAAGPAAVALMDELGPPIADALGPMPYVRNQRFLDGAWQDGFQNYWKAEYLAALPDAAIETVAERSAQITSPLSDVKFLQMGGAERPHSAGGAYVNFLGHSGFAVAAQPGHRAAAEVAPLRDRNGLDRYIERDAEYLAKLAEQGIDPADDEAEPMPVEVMPDPEHEGGWLVIYNPRALLQARALSQMGAAGCPRPCSSRHGGDRVAAEGRGA
jgi:FAD binding domain